jgi:hypothetical protein
MDTPEFGFHGIEIARRHVSLGAWLSGANRRDLGS